VSVREILLTIVRMAREHSGVSRWFGWFVYVSLGTSILALIAGFVSCTALQPIEQLKEKLSSLDQSTGTRNQPPHGGVNEKSDRSPCCPCE
jgi:Na+/H+-dicarboxylate symporter